MAHCATYLNYIKGEMDLRFDLFTKLFKYKESSKLSPAENYLTELFSFILIYLIENNKEIAIHLLDYLGIKINNCDSISIETQWECWVKKYNHFAKPDIKITIGKNVYFIESKIDSNINQYGNFDQIQLYEAIEIEGCFNKGVRTLTKHEIFTNRKYLAYSNECKKFWSKIYIILAEFDELKNDILIQCFLEYLKENDMAEKRSLTYSSEGLSNFYSLYYFLNNVLTDFALKNGYTENSVVLDSCSDYFGFSISYNKKKVIWCGCFTGSEDLVIQSWVEDEDKLLNKIQKDNIDIDVSKLQRAKYNAFFIFGKLSIKNILEEKTFEKQKKIFEDFLEVNKIEKVLSVSWDILQ